MAIVLDAVATSPTFNCYATIAEADDYFTARLHASSWTSAVTATKTSALLWASRQLDALSWRGVRVSGTQPMAFPRKGLSYYEYSPGVGGMAETYDMSGGYSVEVVITEVATPPFLRDAACELAFWLLQSDTTAPSGTENFSRIKVDVIDIQLKNTEGAKWFNKAVRDLVWRFLANANPFVAPTQRVG